MGMFDTIRFNVPIYTPGLPNLNFNRFTFQTKDLGRNMYSYYVDVHGQLWVIRRSIFANPKNDKVCEMCDLTTPTDGVVFYEFFELSGEFVAFTCDFENGKLSSDIEFSFQGSSPDSSWLGYPFDWSTMK